MWEGAKALLDRAPFYALTRPLAGAALGLVAGGLYGTLCGGLHAVAGGTPGLFLSWLLVSAAAGTAAGFIMGVCTAVDRAVCGQDWALAEKLRQSVKPPADAGPVRPHNRIRAHYPSRNPVE
jgi:hypothetical protein